MIRNLVLSALLLLPLAVAASPKPFGLELGAVTLDEVKDKYTVEFVGQHKYLDGTVYELSASEIGFDGLRTASAAFNKEKVMVGVVAVFHQHRFDDLHEILSQKYKIIHEKIPRLGDKEVEYTAKSGELMMLYAPHMSHSATLEYINPELLIAIQEGTAKEKREKQRNEESQL